MGTGIEWAEESWNPVTGCTPVSEGCAHCYAERLASTRLRGRFGYPAEEPFRVTVHEDRFEQPLRWRKPRRVFVCSMGDLFHEDVPSLAIGRVLNVIGSCPQHTFLLLTKRPHRMRVVLQKYCEMFNRNHPLGNVWVGVTAENQARAEERIPVLLKVPARVRFVSVEPMLGQVDLHSIPYQGDTQYYLNVLSSRYSERRPVGDYDGTWFGFGLARLGKVDWVICGGETGPGARPMNVRWSVDLKDQCVAARVPFFFKRFGDGSRKLDGWTWEEYPG